MPRPKSKAPLSLDFEFFFFFFFLGFWINTKKFLENQIGECPKPRSEFSMSIENILIKTKKRKKKKRQTHNSCTLMNCLHLYQPCFSSRFRKQNNITRDHGSVVVIWLGHLECKMNLIGGRGRKKRKKKKGRLLWNTLRGLQLVTHTNWFSI
jgi:hypothetical protein